MNEIKRVLFNKHHLELMEIQEEFKPLLQLDGVRFVLDRIPLPGADGLTLMCNGQILVCFGYIHIVPGVVEVWLFPSVYVQKYPLTLVTEVIGYLESTAKVLNWHRVQTVTQDNAQHRKWMKTLGFVEEGLMKYYLNKQDYVMSARYFVGENQS